MEERRKINPIETAVSELSTEFMYFKDMVKGDLEDYGKRLERYMEYSGAMQRQMQESLQRQLDQNNEQHKEIVSVFKEAIDDNKRALKDQIEGFTKAAEVRIDAIVESQRLEDIDRNNRLAQHETWIIELQGAADKRLAASIRNVRAIAVSALITLIVTLGGTWAFNSIMYPQNPNIQTGVVNK